MQKKSKKYIKKKKLIISIKIVKTMYAWFINNKSNTTNEEHLNIP